MTTVNAVRGLILAGLLAVPVALYVVSTSADPGEEVDQQKLAKMREPGIFDDLPDDEKRAAMEKASADELAARVEFAEEIFPMLGLLVANLPRAHFLASYLAEFESVEETARNASLIARVRVSDIRFSGYWHAITTVEVVEYWRAVAPKRLTSSRPAQWRGTPTKARYTSCKRE